MNTIASSETWSHVALQAEGMAARRFTIDILTSMESAAPVWLELERGGALATSSSARAFYLRSPSTDEGLAWHTRRWMRLGVQMGVSERDARESCAAFVRDYRLRKNAATGQVSESSPMPR